MIMTRDVTLRGLEESLSTMHDIAKMQSVLADIQRQCIKLTPAKKMWNEKLGFGIRRIIITLVSLLVLFNNPILYIPIRLATVYLDYSMSLLLVRVFAVIISILMPKLVAKIHNIWARRKNVRIEEQNDRIRLKNRPLTEKGNVAIGRINELAAILRQIMSGWFPDAYATIHHVEAFLYYIQNHEADSMKEAIACYKTDKHRNQMEQAQRAILNSQEEMVRQQRFGNMLAAASLFTQMGTQHAANRGARAQEETRDAVKQGLGM